MYPLGGEVDRWVGRSSIAGMAAAAGGAAPDMVAGFAVELDCRVLG